MKTKIKIVLLGVVLSFFSCMAGHRMMTVDAFSTFNIGTTPEELEKKAGKPDRIQIISENEKIYEYVEKISSEDMVVEQRTYIFIFKDGQLTSKKMKFDKDLLDDRNAYELQTSQRPQNEEKDKEKL